MESSSAVFIQCEECDAKFRHKHHLNRHIKSQHTKAEYKCGTCGVIFTRRDNLSRHIHNNHSSTANDVVCEICKATFKTVRYLAIHMQNVHHPSRKVEPRHIGIYTNTGRFHLPAQSGDGGACTSHPPMLGEEAVPSGVHLQNARPLEPAAIHPSVGLYQPGPSGVQPQNAGPLSVGTMQQSSARPNDYLYQPGPSGVHLQNPETIRQLRPSVIMHTRDIPQNQGGMDRGAETNSPSAETCEFLPVETAFRSRLATYAAKNFPAGDMESILSSCQYKIENLLSDSLSKFTSIKFNLFVECEFKHLELNPCLRNFKTKSESLLRTSNIHEVVSSHISKIQSEMQDSELRGSGWFYNKIHKIEIRVNEYTPFAGRGHMILPDKFQNLNSLINIRNDDDFCFKYCVLSKFIESDKEMWASYLTRPELNDKYDWNCVKFPVSIHDIEKFSKRNNISINVFGLEEKRDGNHMSHFVFPIKIVENQLADHRDLLYVCNEENSHYIVISDFDAFVRPFVTSCKNHVRVCKRCFTHFQAYAGKSADVRLKEHLALCNSFSPVRCEIPKNPEVVFNKPEYSQKIRFVIYADFECLLEPISGCLGDPQKSWTTPYQKHKPFSFSYFIKDAEGAYSQLRLFRGEDASGEFMRSLVADVKEIDKVLNSVNKPMTPLTGDEIRAYDSATICHICGEGNFTDVNYRVRDHCHVSGRFRGLAHRNCNLNYRNQAFVPVVLHNLSNYDAHFIVKELGFDQNRINVICNTQEKYVTFSKFIPSSYLKRGGMELRFVDSFRFMASSLEKLANNLPKDKFTETVKVFGENANLVCRKGVFPYDYVTSVEILKEKKLPPKDAFYNRLANENISDQDYSHARNVWNSFSITSLGEYSDLYLKTDVLILTDVFENFRQMCFETYGMDCLYYSTVPGFAYSAMLKFTKVKLPLLTDMDMIQMFERGIRGGICQCVTRHAVANNELCEQFDESAKKSYLYYVDANNLYGYAMSQALPSGEFRWLDADEIATFDIMSIPVDSKLGYVLEVDIEYPDHLHDAHSDLPFCAEMKIPPGSKNKKLLTTLESKEKYVVHHTVLKQAVQHGLRLSKIHRVIEFQQSCWLKPYIDYNTAKRRAAANNFEKDFFKLMNNAVFGKTMENVRKRINFRLVSNEKEIKKLVAKSNFMDRTIYSENLVGVHLAKTSLVFDKAIYVGMSILEISKTRMFEFHYDTMKNFYKEGLKLCYMDTDSFVYKIETDDLFRDMMHFRDELDTSVYPPEHPLYSTENKAVVGKFKDEGAGHSIKAFVGLRAKMYAIKFNDMVIKKLKGVKKNVIDKDVNFEDYVGCLQSGQSTYSLNRSIRSYKHNVFSISMNKLTLSGNDDKRHILENCVDTLAHGHYQIREEEEEDCDEEPPTKKCKF